LYLAGTAQYAQLLEKGFAEAKDAEACIKLLVTSYIDWVVANPNWARFILHSRGRVEAGELAEQLREGNRQHFGQIAEVLRPHREAGAFKPMPADCFASVVIGPTHNFARNWLAGRRATCLSVASCSPKSPGTVCGLRRHSITEANKRR